MHPDSYSAIHSKSNASPRGFTLIDLSAVLVVFISLTALAGPTLNLVKKERYSTTSGANLRQIGQAAAMYAAVNDDRIPTYSWRTGETYTLANGTTRTPGSDQDAASQQNRDLLMRMTGWISGPGSFRTLSSHLVHRRFVHLPLWDFMGRSFRSHIWADPADANLLSWQQNPLSVGHDSGVPYGNGHPSTWGYDTHGSWTTQEVRQRWAFTSSYETVPAAWAPRLPETYGPISETPHFFTTTSNLTPTLSNGRRTTEVVFPSRKVHMFEEFDRDAIVDMYFAYDFAAPDKLMFDGSLNTQSSADARFAAHPFDYPSTVRWKQKYVPLDTFPLPLSGLGETLELDMRYRWTFNGLLGWDYAP